MAGFPRVEGRLRCGEASLEEAADRFGTPLYVYNRADIEQSYREYQQAFAAVPHRICYALKANSSGAILRLLAELGAGADIVSGGELLAALRAGFGPETIVFSGVGKTEAEIALGVEKRIGEWNAESEEEIRRISAAAVAAGRQVRVSLRVNPDVDAKSHPYISTGLRENKFGVDIAIAPEVLHRANQLPAIAITGLQCHIGSQIVDLDPIEQAVRALLDLWRRLRAEGLPLVGLDIGGGLGIDYDGGGAPDPQALAQRLLPLLGEPRPTLLIEPGRSVLARAGVLLTRVLYLKENRGKLFVIVDAGMNDLVRPSLYASHHRIEPVVMRAGGQRTVDVVGPVCESGDFLARDRALPPLQVGDLLVVRDAGAYGFSMSSNYNLRPRAAEVLVEGGRVRLIRRRESFEDLVRTEVVDV